MSRALEFFQDFSRHPATAGLTYGSHFAFAARFGLRMIGGGLAALVHALVPPCFQTTASQTVRGLHRELS